MKSLYIYIISVLSFAMSNAQTKEVYSYGKAVKTEYVTPHNLVSHSSEKLTGSGSVSNTVQVKWYYDCRTSFRYGVDYEMSETNFKGYKFISVGKINNVEYFIAKSPYGEYTLRYNSNNAASIVPSNYLGWSTVENMIANIKNNPKRDNTGALIITSVTGESVPLVTFHETTMSNSEVAYRYKAYKFTDKKFEFESEKFNKFVVYDGTGNKKLFEINGVFDNFDNRANELGTLCCYRVTMNKTKALLLTSKFSAGETPYLYIIVLEDGKAKLVFAKKAFVDQFKEYSIEDESEREQYLISNSEKLVLPIYCAYGSGIETFYMGDIIFDKKNDKISISNDFPIQ